VVPSLTQVPSRGLLPEDLPAALARATGLQVAPQPERSVGGGSVGECLRWSSDGGDLFVKLGPEANLGMFSAEADGLRELGAAAALRVPEVRGLGTASGQAFLALEWIEFGSASSRTETALGAGLARLHRTAAPRFGWHRDNTIGATPQHNDWTDDWVQFFAIQRLGVQLDLAERNGHGGGRGGRLVERGRRLCERLGALFAGHRPQPSLLHGDLWGGNWAAVASGAPVIYDPAVYYGDREADLAMTRLFGGLGRGFYQAYESEWPLDPGAEQRVALYNLYHVLNHLNLFGGGYRVQAAAMIERLLAEVG
jgi:fructosamine-3-kinase